MNNESFSENNQYTDQQISTVGPRLKNAREALRLTITDIARQLRLADERIESLENDDYQNMPGMTFVKGYLRAYARLVNVPADELIADFERLNFMPETKSFILSSQKRPILLSGKSLRWVVYLMGIGLLILAVTWRSSLTNSEPVKNAPPASAVNAPKNLDNPVSALDPAKNAVQEEAINTASAVSTVDTLHDQEESTSTLSQDDD